MKITKKELADFYGITPVTLFNYEKKQEAGDIKFGRRLDAMLSYYIKENKMASKSFKEFIDGNGDKCYLIYD